MTDRLSLLTVRVLAARRARTDAGALRLSVSPEDEAACEEADTKADDARVALERLYAEFFDTWLAGQVAKQRAADSVAEKIADARAALRAT
jgi:hypothetical protein